MYPNSCLFKDINSNVFKLKSFSDLKAAKLGEPPQHSSHILTESTQKKMKKLRKLVHQPRIKRHRKDILLRYKRPVFGAKASRPKQTPVLILPGGSMRLSSPPLLSFFHQKANKLLQSGIEITPTSGGFWRLNEACDWYNNGTWDISLDDKEYTCQVNAGWQVNSCIYYPDKADWARG